MKEKSRVRIEKLQESPGALFPAAILSEWAQGEIVVGVGFEAISFDESNAAPNEGKSLPVSWVVEGVLQRDIEIGKSCLMLREKRNDVVALGIFETSEVVGIAGDLFTTRNSVYRVSSITQS